MTGKQLYELLLDRLNKSRGKQFSKQQVAFIIRETYITLLEEETVSNNPKLTYNALLMEEKERR